MDEGRSVNRGEASANLIVPVRASASHKRSLMIKGLTHRPFVLRVGHCSLDTFESSCLSYHVYKRLEATRPRIAKLLESPTD